MDTKLSPSVEDDDILRAARPRLVGLAGRAGSGKSLASETLVANGWSLVKFAAPGKSMLRTFFSYTGMTDEEIERRIEGDLKEEPCDWLRGKSPRVAMQTIGGDWGRGMIADDIWINLWRRAVRSEFLKGRNVVVDDVRYANEADVIRASGGVILMIERPDNSKEVPDHSSERFLFQADSTVLNDGSKEDLLASLGDFIPIVGP